MFKYGTVPRFGDFLYSPMVNEWAQDRVFADGKALLVTGGGDRPSDRQIALFEEFDMRLDELRSKAIANMKSTLMSQMDDPGIFDGLVLAEVRVRRSDLIEMIFHTNSDSEMWPMVTMSDWEIVRSEWIA